MRVSAALLTTLLAGIVPVAGAQQPATAYILPPQPASCPVDLWIQQRSATEIVRAGDKTPETPAQHLETSVRPHPSVEPIDSITIAVRGVGSQRQTLPLSAFPGSARSDDLQQTFHLRRTADDPTFIRSGIRVPR